MAVPSWFEKDVYFNNKLQMMGEGWDSLQLKAAFDAAGYSTDAEGLYRHFLDYGNAEGVSASSWFDSSEYLYNKAADYYGRTNITGQNANSMLVAMNQAGMSPYEHFHQYWAESFASKGVFHNPSQSFDTAAYMNAKLAEMQKGDPAYTMEMLVKDFQDIGLDPIQHYEMYGKAEGLSVNAATLGNTYQLTTGDDEIQGTAGNDYINAKIGTLDDRDYIDGQAGHDTLYANIESGGANDVISPEIQNVETILFRVQQATGGTGSNLTKAYFDAENVYLADGQMLTLGSDNSRSSLTIEDVRHKSTETTVRFSNTDPGAVDFSVYFDAQHLAREDSQTTGTLYAQLIDTVGALPVADGGHADPLYDNPYTGFKFSLNGKEYTLNFGAYNHTTDESPSYDELVAQMQAAIDADSELSGLGLTVTKGDVFTAVVGIGDHKGETVQGNKIVISSDQGSLEGGNWIASNGLPPTNSTSATFSDDVQTTCPLIQTNVELDNVGRVQWDDASPCLPDDSIFGSEAGKLVIGSNAGRGGVERFDVVVDKGSWLSSLSSTNDTLRLVTVKNGAVNGDNDNGNLFIGTPLDVEALGNTGANPATDAELVHWMNVPRLLSTDGLTNVKVFDASEMNGKVNIGAQLTDTALDKYMADVDGLNTMYGNYAPSGDFRYYLGTNDDTLNMKVNAGIAADRDFKLDIQTNAGNDLVNFSFENLTGSRLLNQIALNNVSIDLGAGDDEVWFWGNGAVKVNDGAGDDKVYVGQNAHDQNAVFVFGANNEAETFIKAGPDGAQPLQNEVVATNATGLEITSATAGTVTVTVTFNGITSEVTLDVAAGQTGISVDDVNHAIIAAINEDPTLGALLVAKDGMGHSLLVESLVDGAFAGTDLSVNFAGTNVTIGANGVYANGANDSDLAVNGVEAVDSALDIVTQGAGGTPEVQALTAALDFGTGVATDAYTVVYSGKAYTFERGADETAMATAMQTELVADHTGLTVAGAKNADGTYTFTITGATAGGDISDDTVLVKGTPADVAGTDLGTTSMNTVDLTAGNDVIALNVNSSHTAFDTLVLNGAFGDDTVLGFQTAIDKIDATGLGLDGKVLDTTKVIDATNAHYGIDGITGLTAGKNIVVVQNADAAADEGSYWVFSVTSTDGTIDASDTVNLLGTLSTGEDNSIAIGDIIAA